MSTKTPAVISATLTIATLVLLAVIFVLFQMLALNGASEKQGMTAMGVSLGCQSLVIIFLGILAARATDFLIKKVGWDKILAVVVTVIAMTMIGGAISFLVTIVAIPLTGIR